MWRKIGGIGGRGNEENSARAAPKGGGDKGWETQVYNEYHFKRTRNIQTRLAHLNYFFGFVLADFTLLTWNSKKNVHIFLYIFLNKRVHILNKVTLRSV